MNRQPISRRHFLGAASAVPLVVSSRVLGLGGAVAPGDRIGMGFIGIGGQGGGHLFGGAWTYISGGYLAREDVQVLAVCDVVRQKREAGRDRVNRFYADRAGQGNFKSCEAYNDLRELLAREDIDAVLVGSPNHWHAPMAIMAARAGKDVYCEKPTAITICQSRMMADTVRRYGRVYQAGTQQRSEYGGKFRRACELVRSRRIGELKEVYANIGGAEAKWVRGFGAGKPVPDGFDYDLFLGPAPWSPYGTIPVNAFVFDGGNWEQHHYDFVQWVIDADRTGPVEIGVEKGRAIYRFASGVVVYGRSYPGERVGGSGGATFVGTEGRIAVDRDNLVAYPPKIAEKPLGPDVPPIYRCISHSGNFLECVRTRKRTICDAETAHRAASFVLLGGIAQRLNRTVKWDPVKEQFIDDPEATRLMSLPARPPWRL